MATFVPNNTEPVTNCFLCNMIILKYQNQTQSVILRDDKETTPLFLIDKHCNIQKVRYLGSGKSKSAHRSKGKIQ